MKRRLLTFAAVLFAGILLYGGQTAFAAFSDNGNGTVSDSVTGLMWQQSDDGTERTWEEALSYAESLSLGGHSDWRLPNVRELESLVDAGRYNPAIDTTYFPNCRSSYYWSSSPYVNISDDAWNVDFGYGHVSGNDKTGTYYVRCVRAGPSGSFEHSIISTAGTGGTISPSGTVTVAIGGSAAFTMTANNGFEISDVKVDGASQGAIGTYTFSNVNQDHTISASFVAVASSTTTTSTTTSSTTTTPSTTSTTTTTLPSSPTVTTGPATPEPTSATLTGTINPNGLTSRYYFEWGTNSKYGASTPSRPVGSGTADKHVDEYIAPLKQDTTYYYRLVASTDMVEIYGDGKDFTTSQPTEVTDSKVIMVAGGGPYAGNTIWDQVEMLSANAYKALLFQGYTRDAIYYLSPNLSHDVNGDKISDVDADATGENLENAIKFFAQDPEIHQLVLYLVGHGGPEKFQIGETEEVSVQNLNTWLNDAQTGMVDQVVVLYDACRSGSFLPFLPPPAGKERIIAASSESGQNALILADGTVSFSYLFWSHIFNGDGFYHSFLAAQDSLEITFPKKQNPQIEADGNGVGNDKADQTIAEGVTLGLGLHPQGALPSIGTVTSSSRAVLLGASAIIYAEDVAAVEGVHKVWAVITPPGYSAAPGAPITDLPILYLSKSDGLYQGTYGDFTTEGEYNIAVFVEDNAGFLSVPKKTTVMVMGGCLSVADDLSIWVPCAEHNGVKYGFTLNFAQQLNDLNGYYWKLDMATLTPGEGAGCIPIAANLSMSIPCVAYNGAQYGFRLDFYENAYDSKGLYWKMDKGTLVAK